MAGDSDIEELPDVDDDLAEYGDLDAVLRQGNRITQSAAIAQNSLLLKGLKNEKDTLFFVNRLLSLQIDN